MDLSHGSSFYQPAQVRSATPDEMRDATAIVIAAGRGGRPGESRLDLLKDNARVVRDLAAPLPRLHRYGDRRDEPGRRAHPPICGGFRAPDRARPRHGHDARYRAAQKRAEPEACMSRRNRSMRRWSANTAIRKSCCGRVRRVAGVPLARWPGWDANEEPLIADEVRTAAYEIIRRKGATNHAIGLVTARRARVTRARRESSADGVSCSGRHAGHSRCRAVAADDRRGHGGAT